MFETALRSRLGSHHPARRNPDQVGDGVGERSAGIVPEGGVHAFRNESGAPASMLIHFAPGAPREAYFEANAEFARSGRPSDAEMADLYLRHDNHLVMEAI